MPVTPASVTSLPAPTPLTPLNASGGSGMSFGDVLDAVNPLQHIPIVSSLYRAATGSSISAASEVAGDTLYGALLPGGAIMGLASSVADVAVKQLTGKNIGQLAVGAVTPSATAANATAATPLTPLPPGTVIEPAMPSIPLVADTHLSVSGNAQYARAQAFDALNRQLMHMSS